jgi:hypothetical protein
LSRSSQLLLLEGHELTTTHAAGIKAIILGGVLVAHQVAFFNTAGTCKTLYPAKSKALLGINLCEVNPGSYKVGSNCIGDGGGFSVTNGVLIAKPGATSGTIFLTQFDVSCGGS